MKDELLEPKDVSAKQTDFLRRERPVGTWGFYDGSERYKFADELPGTPRKAVEKWDWIFAATVARGSNLVTYIEAHRPEPKTGLQDADLYLYVYGQNPGEGGKAYQLKHPSYEGRSMPLASAPTSGLDASSLAQLTGLSPSSGVTGLLTSEHTEGLDHFQKIVVAIIGT